jgi:hypothetical protein
VHLNYLPLRFTSDVFGGGVLALAFEGNPKDLGAKEYGRTRISFRRFGLRSVARVQQPSENQ